MRRLLSCAAMDYYGDGIDVRRGTLLVPFLFMIGCPCTASIYAVDEHDEYDAGSHEFPMFRI